MAELTTQHDVKRRMSFYVLMIVAVCGVWAGGAARAANLDSYRAMPPFLADSVKPNVLFMYDNSGSMKNFMNKKTTFNSSKSYYGMFDSTKKYKYDHSIPVDMHGYDGSRSHAYNVGDNDGNGQVDILDQKGAFVEDPTCTLAIGNNCWSGNFLNWLVTRRVDAARQVLVGGKVEDRDGYDYLGNNTLQWKIVGNNERSDKTQTVNNPNNGTGVYNPLASVLQGIQTQFKVTSPAVDGDTRSAYAPYGIFYPTGASVITDINNTIIGESGHTTLPKGNPPGWVTIHLQHTYTDPVVIATPLSFNGSDPSVVWIKNVTSNSFKLRVKEWDYRDQNHYSEEVMYFVVEKGTHTLISGQHIVAGSVSGVGTSYTSLSLSSFSFSPVVLTSVVHSQSTWSPTTTARIKNVSTSGFDLRVQAQENDQSSLNEQVSYIALDKGEYESANYKLIVGTAQVNHQWQTIKYPVGAKANFLASIQSEEETDTASLRYRNLTHDSVEIFVAEEGSKDPETVHSLESVGYVFLQPHSFNIALVTQKKPLGLLHDVKDKVRLGISFYKYAHDNDMYNGEDLNGGTLLLQIPDNPFVRKASDTTFRSLSTYVTTDIDNIVDAIEHYPLVWGTTPLAENYYDVIRYFQQETPYYDSTHGGGTLASYKVANFNTGTDLEWDPYYFKDPNGDGNQADAGKIPCAKSFVLLFTDGGSYRDGYIPNSPINYIDFDGDGNYRDCFTTKPHSLKCDDNLDDLAKWAHCANGDQNATCANGVLRDLRTDLTGEQNLTTYTVAFGSATPPKNLRDAAKYGEGIAYGAEDGYKLKEQLTSMFSAIVGRASGTALSVVSSSNSGEGAVYQSVFFPEKEEQNTSTPRAVNWAGQVHALFVDAYGFLHEDTDTNKQLDPLSDRIVTIKDDGTADLFVDANGNHILDQSESLANESLDSLHYLWTTSDWLNDTSLDPVHQRSVFISNDLKRYVFTGVDANQDGYVGPSDTRDFTAPLQSANLSDRDELYPYLTLYPTMGDRPSVLTQLINTTDFDTFLLEQTTREVNWIRGKDYVDSQGQPETLVINGNFLTGLEMRSRQIDYDGDGSVNTWRLGDIVYSSPTVVGKPMENFHLLYHDQTYSKFADKYHERRQVIYTGSNDGMIHAFNGGFYNARSGAYCREINSNYDPLNPTMEPPCLEDKQPVNQPRLGAELWGYIPYNLLPHLYWLTETSYNKGQHVYYVDQKPRIFDAKIFQAETSCTANYLGPNCIHPDGWGTVMVVGMRLGGGTIATDVNRNDQPDYVMEEYNDSNSNNQWESTETVTVDCDGDGQYDPGPMSEAYTDSNNNGQYDAILDEPYTDWNNNGQYDASVDEPFLDCNQNGSYDGTTPVAEWYLDADGDNHYDPAEPFTDWNGNGQYDTSVDEPFTDCNGNGLYDSSSVPEEYNDCNQNNQWDSSVQETYTDTNNDNNFDLRPEQYTDLNHNGVHDNAPEDFNDCNQNGHWDAAVTESFTDADGDGHYDAAAEPFQDLSGDGQYGNFTEPWQDYNGNGHYDAGETYTDLNHNGQYDAGAAEPFTDRDGDNHWDAGDTLHDCNNNGHLDTGQVAEWYNDWNNNGHYDVSTPEPYQDVDGDGHWDAGGETFTDCNGNGRYNSAPVAEWLNDCDGNGQYSSSVTEWLGDYNGNNQRDTGLAEPFHDLDGDTHYDAGEQFFDCNNNRQRDTSVTETFTDWDGNGSRTVGLHEPFTDLNGDGVWSTGVSEPFIDCNNNGIREDLLPLKSSYMVFDITNPEQQPVLLGEISPPKLGFTTVYPTVIAMRDGDHDETYEDYDQNSPANGENRWFLVFGSGPADENGFPGSLDKDGNYDSQILDLAISKQPGGIYVLDLNKLATNHQVHTLDNTGALNPGFQRYVSVGEVDSFIGTPVTVDLNLDYNADVVYYGTVSGSAGAWGGKLHRIVVDDKYDNDDDMDPANWEKDKILFDTADTSLVGLRPTGWTGQPITAAPTVGLDDDDRYWVYFGTGRFIVPADQGVIAGEQNSFYGIKELVVTIQDPSDPSKTIDVLNWDELTSTNSNPLMNVTDYDIYTGGYFDDGSGSVTASDDWDTLVDDQHDNHSGWFINFAAADTQNMLAAEKNVSQAALLGGLLTFTTYTPSGDVCHAGGTSSLWGVYYKTGTAYKESVFGLGSNTATIGGQTETEVLRKLDMGNGMLSSPSVHVGRETGSAVFVQSSKGEVTRIEEKNPLQTKSGKQSWQQQ